LGGRSHEIPNCYVGGCGLSGCGRLGALFLPYVPKSDNPSRNSCVEPRTSNSTNRVRQFSFPFRHRCLLGPSCECCYLWLGRADRGNNATEATSRTVKT